MMQPVDKCHSSTIDVKIPKNNNMTTYSLLYNLQYLSSICGLQESIHREWLSLYCLLKGPQYFLHSYFYPSSHYVGPNAKRINKSTMIIILVY